MDPNINYVLHEIIEQTKIKHMLSHVNTEERVLCIADCYLICIYSKS